MPSGSDIDGSNSRPSKETVLLWDPNLKKKNCGCNFHVGNYDAESRADRVKMLLISDFKLRFSPVVTNVTHYSGS